MDKEIKTILIVDDDYFLVDILGFTLEQSGYKVLKAQNGEEALEVIKDKKPNLVLADIMMPRMSGFQMREEMNKDESIKNIPVIFLTAKGSQTDKEKGEQIGAVDYIVKPFNLTDLLKRIEKAINT